MQPLSNEQKVIDEFRKRRNRQIAATLPVIAAMVMVFYVSDHPDAVVLGLKGLQLLYACIAVVAVGLVFALYNWRCPACNKYLGKGMNPKFCPKCGAKLH